METRTSLPRTAASLLAVLGMSFVGVALLVALSHVQTPPVDMPATPAAGSPPETPAAETAAPAQTAAPAETAPAPAGLVEELRGWGKEMTPKLFAYTSEASAGGEVKTKEDALAWCAGLTDEVEGMSAVRAAPDPIVESEYRATVSETKAVVASCLNGDGAQMKSHNQAMTQHMQAMLDRINLLDPENASDR